jgi:hypothetical protein
MPLVDDLEVEYETMRVFRRLLMPRLTGLTAGGLALAWMGVIPWEAPGFIGLAGAGCLSLVLRTE